MSKKRKRDSQAEDSIEDIQAKKSARKSIAKDADIAKLLDDLRNEDQEIRSAACSGIVSVVAIPPISVKKESNGDHVKKEKQELSSFQEQIITRLIRGLCSSKWSSRKGFSSALVIIFRNLAEVYRKNKTDLDFVNFIRGKIEEATRTPEGPTEKEIRDHAFGRMLGLDALLCSGALFHTADNFKETKVILDEMQDLTKKRSVVFQTQFGQSLMDAVDIIVKEHRDSRHTLMLIQHLCSNGNAKTPDGLALWLKITKKFPDLKLPKNTWHHRDPFNKKELGNVAKILKQESIALTDNVPVEDSATMEARQMTLHPVWELVLTELVDRIQAEYADDDARREAKAFSKIWNDAVELGYFAETASPNRKALGFRVLSKIVISYPAWMIEASLTKNVMTCIINQSARSERALHGDSEAFLGRLLTRTQDDPACALPIYRSLTSEHGSIHFDSLTKNHVLAFLLCSIKKEPLYDIIEKYRDLCAIQHVGKASDLGVCKTISDHLLTLIRDQVLAISKAQRLVRQPEAIAFKEPQDVSRMLCIKILEVLAVGALSPLDEGASTWAVKAQEEFRSKLSSSLSAVLRSTMDQGLSTVPTALVLRLWDTLGRENKIKILRDADEEVSKTLTQAHNYLRSVSQYGSRDGITSGPLQLIVAMTILQAYDGDLDAINILHELESLYSPTLSLESRARVAAPVVVEIILTFSSKNSPVLRHLSQQVFPAYMSKLTFSSIQSMIRVLEQSESLSGQSNLFDDADDAESVDEIQGEKIKDEEESSSGESSEVDGGVPSTDSEMSEDSAQAQDEDKDAAYIALDQALSKALKVPEPTANGTTADALNEKDTDLSDASMDDDQMMALEPQLTEIFKQRAIKQEITKASNRKRAQKDAKQNMLNFKNRVLDLLLIYIKGEHANLLCLQLILPLLELMRKTSSKQIAEKASNLLRTFFDSAKKHGFPVSVDKLHSTDTTLDVGSQNSVHQGSEDHTDVESPLSTFAILEDVHSEALTFASKAHAATCSRASILLSRCLVKENLEVLEQINSIYGNTMSKMLKILQEKRSALPMTFFNDFAGWCKDMKL